MTFLVISNRQLGGKTLLWLFRKSYCETLPTI